MNFNKLVNKIKDYQINDSNKELFRNKRRVIITDFFDNKFAELIFRYIQNIPLHKWKHVCGMDTQRFESNITNSNKLKIGHFIREANKYFINNRFAYSFHRTLYLKPNETATIESDLYNLLKSQDTINYINEITKMNITKLNQVFISKYKAGHFLSPHSDKGNGRLAFVINITKNWLPQYGGNLHFLNNDRKIIIDSISPIFNSMILFEIPEPEGIPHFVSHVIPGIKISRYAISGWYE